MLYDADNDRYYVAGVDATGQKLADALEYFFTEWAGYTYLPGYELLSNLVWSTPMVRLCYVCTTQLTRTRSLRSSVGRLPSLNANEPNNKVTDLYDTTYYGGQLQ